MIPKAHAIFVLWLLYFYYYYFFFFLAVMKMYSNQDTIGGWFVVVRFRRDTGSVRRFMEMRADAVGYGARNKKIHQGQREMIIIDREEEGEICKTMGTFTHLTLWVLDGSDDEGGREPDTGIHLLLLMMMIMTMRPWAETDETDTFKWKKKDTKKRLSNPSDQCSNPKEAVTSLNVTPSLTVGRGGCFFFFSIN